MISYSARSWLSVLFRIQGTVLPRLVLRILAVGAIATFASWVNAKYGFKLPTTVHTLIGVALGLLLVFRTNTSYDRYWEGRKLLSTLTSKARDLGRQFNTMVPLKEVALRRELTRLVIVWFATVRQALRHETDLSKLGIELKASEVRSLEGVGDRPALVLQWLSALTMRAMGESKIPSYCIRTIDVNYQIMGESFSSAERIRHTPVPFAYAHHIKSFLAVFCFSVPFALTDTLKWATPLVSMLVAWAMFGIEEIGVEIEDPFGYDANDLPLDEIQEAIESDLRAMAIAAGGDGHDPTRGVFDASRESLTGGMTV